MKKLITQMIRIILLLALGLSFTLAKAQIKYAPLTTEDFSLSIQNLSQTAPDKLEFDVYLLDTDPDQPFEFAICQLGFLFNSGIYNGGTVTAAIDNTNSGLPPSLQYTAAASVVATLNGYPNQTLLRMAGKVPPGAGNGPIISTVAPGTLLTHFIISSSVPWTANSTANMAFNSNTVTIPLYATRVAAYLGTVNTQLAVNPGINALVCCNPLLNLSGPSAYAINGSGSYCEATSGLPVGLDNSETGVTYTLFKDGVSQLPTVEGTTGETISFGNQLSGTYTVSGTNSIGTTPMSGNAVLTETATVPVSVVISSDANSICAGTTTTFTATPAGDLAPSYQWYVNAAASGFNQSTYAYVPANGDQVTVTISSALPCASPIPAISNTIIMDVLPTVAASVSIGVSQNNVCAGTAITFTATPSGGGTAPTYQWYKNTVAVNTGDTYTYIPANGDIVYVVMASNAICATGSPATSNSATVTVITINAPVISQVGTTLSSNAPTGNQWYKNGVIIEGATDAIYEVTENATYSCIVTINGCSSETSNSLVVINVGIANPSAGQFEIFPVPSDGLFTAILASPSAEIFAIRVYNNIGILVFEKKDVPVNGTTNQTIDMRPVPSGIYTVTFTSGTSQVVRKMIIKRD